MGSKIFNQRVYLADLEKLFRQHGKQERAEGAKAYMRDQFDYIGLDTTTRRHLQTEFHKAHPLPPKEKLESLVKALWKSPHREMQYFAMELYEKYKKQISAKDIPAFEMMITNKSWWDTVDFVAPKLIGVLHQNFPELQERNCKRWMKSKNIWLMRAAIIHQNLYKKKTNEVLLFKLISQCMDHEDFFIRKAIGWSLRQYARTNPSAVKKFVLANKSKLSMLSQKEALKHVQ